MRKILILLFVIIILSVVTFINGIENNILRQENAANIEIIERLNIANNELTIKVNEQAIEKAKLKSDKSDLVEELLEIKTVSREGQIEIVVPVVSITPTPTPKPTTKATPTPRPKVSVSESQVETLARIIYCEAGAESTNTQMAIGQVVLNRMNKYNMTLKETVYQKNTSGIYVFSPVASSKYSSRSYSKESEKIAIRLLGGEKYKPVGGALYFCTVGSYESRGWHYDYVKNHGGEVKLILGGVVFIE